MIYNQINDSDKIILNSVESYLKSLGTPANIPPQEKLVITQQARDALYSDIVRRVPRIASYILSADIETNDTAQALFMALSKHAMDPVFVNLLMQYLSQINNPEENGVVGALLARIMNKYVEQHWQEPAKPVKKGDKTESDEKSAANDMSAVAHIQMAVNQLLGHLADIICTRCGNVTHAEATAIAACLATNNQDTIKEIIESDLPITANIFDIVADPSNLIKNALLMEKANYTKLSTNQAAFVESLKRWVYNKLNEISTQASFRFLVAVYGSIQPADTTKYLIQLKDCGTQYSNLLTVAKQLINK